MAPPSVGGKVDLSYRLGSKAKVVKSGNGHRRNRSASGGIRPYRLFRPRVEPGRRYPLVLFLHGSGGSGTDNVKQLERANWFGGQLAIEIVESLVNEFPVDRARIYITGHSMGGAGTRHVLAQRPDLFAAGVPVCGCADLATLPRLKDVPVWNFHGVMDEIEPIETSRRIIAALQEAGGQPLYTEYPYVGHNVFMWAYTEPALVKWLFAQHRSSTPATE